MANKKPHHTAGIGILPMNAHLPGGRRPSWIVGACFALPFLASAADVPDVDLRRAPGQRATPGSAQVEAVARLQSEVPEARILWHPVTAAPLWVHSTSGFLTGPESEEGFLSSDATPVLGDAIGRVKRFLDRNAGLFGHGSAALDQAVIRRDYVTEHSGMRTIVWQQMLAGVPVFEGTLTAHLTRQGELVSLSSRMLAHPEQAAGRALGDWATRLVAPPVAAEVATASAARSLGEATEAGAIAVVRRSDGANQERRLTGPGIAAEARARLVWVPLGPEELQLGWEVVLEGATSRKLYQVILDADTAQLLVRHCWTSKYTPVPMTVFPGDSPTPMSPGHSSPNTQQPAQVNRTVLYGPPAFTLASPQGWIAAGRNDTIGNNADARLDLDDENLTYGYPDVAPPRPVASGNYPLDLSQSPPTREDATVKNQSAAVVNAFYWVNWAHDRFYELGFTEAAGNFQNDNYGRGGLGGDAIVVDVQNGIQADPSGYNQNWSDSTPEDGPGDFQQRITLSLFNGPQAQPPFVARDAALHAEVILHEYTHGVIARIVQKHTMFESQYAGVGLGATEAWCDFFALALLAQASDEVTDACYAPMAYHSWYFLVPTAPVNKGGSGQPLVNNYYFGHDLYPVTPDLGRSPLTLAHLHPDAVQPDAVVSAMNEAFVWALSTNTDTRATQIAQRMISLWTSTLWDVRARIIEKYRALHDDDVVGGEMGGEIMLRLALDSLRLCPHVMDPLSGRDALLLADLVYSGGEHHPEIWAAFAARGMGVGATFDNDEFEGGLTITESTSVPVPGQGVQLAQLGAGIYSSPAIGPDGTIYVATAAPDSRLYAFSPAGTQLWVFPSNPGGAAFYSSPAIGADGMIYIGRHDNRLYAVTPCGGQYGSCLVNGQIFSSPAIGPDGTVYCGVRATVGSVRAWYPDLASRWSRDLGASVDASPAIGPDGTVYVGALDGRVWALDGKTGVTKSGWPYATGSSVYSSPAVGGDGTVYFGANNGRLYALSANGQARWVRLLSGELRAPPALGPEGVVYVGSTTGSFWAVDAETGVVRWTQSGLTGVRACPAVAADGTVYVGATDGKVHAFHPDGSANGESFNAFSAIYASPVIGTTGSIYVGTSNGRLYALAGTEGPAQTTWPMFHRNARHTGYDWYPMGEGVELEQTVLCLAVAPDGQVYAGATFTNVSGVEAYRLARWNGSAWGSLVSGGPNGPVTTLGCRSDHLLFGGLFDNLVPGPNLGRYYGTWQTQPGPNGPVYAMVISTSGDVYVGGQFSSANGIPCQNLFKISAGGTYSALGTPVNGVNGPVYALALDGSGRVFAGGTFSSAGGVSCQNVARWNGTGWSAVGGGTDGTVMALAVTGASGNAQVYAGGYLENVLNSGTPSAALGLARWSESGNLWAAIGNMQRLEPEVGGPGSLVPAHVFALAVDGTRVYAGGDFTAVNGLPAAAVAVFETVPPGPMWSALGSGVTTLSGVVETIAVSPDYDFVYVGGRFRSAGGTRAEGVARWRK